MLTFDPQSACNAGSVARVLDLHVSCFTIHVPDIGGTLDRSGREQRRVFVDRITAHPPTGWPELLKLSRAVCRAIHGEVDKSGGKVRLPSLFVVSNGPVLGRGQHLLFGPLA